MKSSIVIIFALVIVLFTSCQKETLSTVDSINISSIENRSTTIELPVTRVNYSEDSGVLSVDFSAAYDFTETVLEQTQYLQFEDASGNPSTLTFSTQSFSGTNGALNAEFLIGGNDLAGLVLTEVQEVIIEDEVIN